MILRRSQLESFGVFISGIVADDPQEQVVVDLHAAEVFHEAGGATLRSLDKPLTLRPNDCVVLKTVEHLVTPTNVFGFLCSRGRLSARGMLVANTKIDPNFRGHLNVPVFNASAFDIQIEKGQAFCSVFFSQMDGHVVSKVIRSAPNSQHPHERRRVAEWWRAHGPLVAVVIAILASLVNFASNFLAYSKNAAPVAANAPPLSPPGSTPLARAPSGAMTAGAVDSPSASAGVISAPSTAPGGGTP